MNEYQSKAMLTRTKQADTLEYMALGLCGEAGEVANKVKKILRGDYGSYALVMDKTYYTISNNIASEIGDVLWYCAGLLDVLGYDMETVAERNLEKLADRQERGVVKGEGDNR